MSSSISDPSTPDRRVVPWSYWADRFELSPESMNPGELARAAWETATSTTQRHFAGVVAEALGQSVLWEQDVSPLALERRHKRYIRHPNRPASGWDRVRWIMENHPVSNPLTGFSGACLMAALAAGAPDRAWKMLTGNGWVGPNQHLLYLSSPDHYWSPRANAVRTWQLSLERQRALMDKETRKDVFPIRPYDIASVFDAVALWGTLERVAELAKSPNTSVCTHMYERAVFLNAAASPERLGHLRKIWLGLVGIEDEKMTVSKANIPTPWFHTPGVANFLSAGYACVPPSFVEYARPTVRHVLGMLVDLATSRLGLSSWISQIQSPIDKGAASQDKTAQDLPPTLAHRGRALMFQVEGAKLEFVPTEKALHDPAGFHQALVIANARMCRPPTNDSDAMVFNQVWALVCAHLCAPDDQSSAWAAYRTHEVCEILEGKDALLYRETARSLLYWGFSLSGLAPPGARVLLGARFGAVASDLDPGLLDLWGTIVGSDVRALISAGVDIAPMGQLPGSSPSSAGSSSPTLTTVRREHLLLSLAAASVDIEIAFPSDDVENSVSQDPPKSYSNRRRL